MVIAPIRVVYPERTLMNWGHGKAVGSFETESSPNSVKFNTRLLRKYRNRKEKLFINADLVDQSVGGD